MHLYTGRGGREREIESGDELGDGKGSWICFYFSALQ